MQMKKNKALLLSGTVLFSVTGSIEKANSAEIQNEINIINDEKPVVTTNVEENKAPRIYEGETMPVTVAKALGKVGVPYVRNNNQKQSGLTDNHEDEKDNKEDTEAKDHNDILNKSFIISSKYLNKLHSIIELPEDDDQDLSIENEIYDLKRENDDKTNDDKKNNKELSTSKESNDNTGTITLTQKQGEGDRIRKEADALPFNKIYEEKTGQSVPDFVKKQESPILIKYNEFFKGQSTIIEKKIELKPWYSKVATTVKSGITRAWTAIKSGFTFGWQKVKSVFKLK